MSHLESEWRIRVRFVDRHCAEFASGHRAHEAPHVDLGEGPRADDSPIPEDRDPVGDLKDLLETVRDIDDCDAALAESPDHGEEMVEVLSAQRGRRLIEDEDA